MMDGGGKKRVVEKKIRKVEKLRQLFPLFFPPSSSTALPFPHSHLSVARARHATEAAGALFEKKSDASIPPRSQLENSERGTMSNMAAAPADAGPKKRLVIKKMVLENFKSYAGAQHVGPFHKVGSASSFVRVTRSVRRAVCEL